VVPVSQWLRAQSMVNPSSPGQFCVFQQVARDNHPRRLWPCQACGSSNPAQRAVALGHSRSPERCGLDGWPQRRLHRKRGLTWSGMRSPVCRTEGRFCAAKRVTANLGTQAMSAFTFGVRDDQAQLAGDICVSFAAETPQGHQRQRIGWMAACA